MEEKEKGFDKLDDSIKHLFLQASSPAPHIEKAEEPFRIRETILQSEKFRKSKNNIGKFSTHQ